MHSRAAYELALLLSAALASLICVQDSAIADQVNEPTAVRVKDPERGSIPDLVYAYGSATPTSAATVTASFQRDGQVSGILVEVGDQFKMGDPLLDFGASPAAVVAYEQAKTTKTLAERSYARQQQLFKQQLATRDQVETAEKAVSDAQLTLEMFEKMGSIKPSEILTAPFDGVVSAISVSTGDRISAGAPLMTLARTDQVILSVGVVPSALAKVKPDLPVHLTSLSPGRKPADGKVKRIGAAIDMKTRQVPVIVELPAGVALAGENFKAGIEVGKFQGWVVPANSVGTNAQGAFVYQIEEGRAKRISVNVIGSVGKNSVVEGDIDSQKEMILAGNYQLDDGVAVRPEEAPAEEEDEDN
jgi:membrane fusion protein (multidrug efflux system)